MEVNIQNLTQSEVDKKFIQNVLEKSGEVTGIENKEVAVVLVGANKIQNLNKRYRRKNRVTYVLSFGADGDNEELGDIVICVPRAKKQAREKGDSFEKELATLLIHGFLHLAGYDHEKKKEADNMQRLEKRICNCIIRH